MEETNICSVSKGEIKLTFRKNEIEHKRGGSMVICAKNIEEAHMKDLEMEQKGYFLESGKKGNEDVTSKIIKPMAGKWKSGGIF